MRIRLLRLASRVLADKPRTGVIITSGYHPDLPETAPAAGPAVVFLPKPSPPENPGQTIRDCLHSG